MARASSLVGTKRSPSQSGFAPRKSMRLQNSIRNISTSSSPSAFDGLTETNDSPSTTPTDLSCGTCGKTMGSIKSLRRHLTAHLAHSPFECMVCHNKFKRRDHLLRHEKDIHEKEGHETCIGCGHVCRKDYLPQHLRADKAASCRKAYEDAYSSITRAIPTEERAALFDSEELGVVNSSGDDLEMEEIRHPVTFARNSSDRMFREHGEIATQLFRDTSEPWTPMDLHKGICHRDIGEHWDPSFERQETAAQASNPSPDPTSFLDTFNDHAVPEWARTYIKDAQQRQPSQHTEVSFLGRAVTTLPEAHGHAPMNSVRRAAEELGVKDLSPLSRPTLQIRPKRLLEQPKCPKLTCKICGLSAGTSKEDILHHARSCLQTASPCHKCSLCKVMFIFKKDLHNHLKPGVGECLNLSEIDHDHDFDQVRLKDRELFVIDLRRWEMMQLDLFRSAVRSAVCEDTGEDTNQVSDMRPATIVFGCGNTCISETPSSAEAKTECQPLRARKTRQMLNRKVKNRKVKSQEVKHQEARNQGVKVQEVKNQEARNQEVKVEEAADDFAFFSFVPGQPVYCLESILSWTYDPERDGVWW